MKRPPQVITMDFETLPIQARPDYPPKPVGVSIKLPGEKAKYYAWDHKTGKNNCSLDTGRKAVHRVWKAHLPILFHNAKFDIDVAQTHLGCGRIDWRRVHDTMFLLFLLDPHAADLKLKPASERLLGLPPEERDEMVDWLWERHKQLSVDFPEILEFTYRQGSHVKRMIDSRTKIGAFVAYAPGDIAGKYANGDSDRTLELFKFLWPRIVDRGMEEAYDRERELLPILLDNERVGLRVDLPRLRKDIRVYSRALEASDEWLRKRLKNSTLNLDNDNEIAEALSNSKIIPEEAWSLTATGKRSVSKKTLLPRMYKDPDVASVFGHRNRLSTCLKMFMLPWERQATARDDSHISTNWNQVRQDSGGTRTGRPSTYNPNFLNISKTWDDKDDGYVHPAFLQPFGLPLVRRYILPDDGDVFIHRDFNGQELRLAAHFEDGPLMQAYQENPRLDPHDYVRELIERIAGLQWHRTQVKITNFRRIYGGGAPATAGALDISIDVAKQLLKAHGDALPGLRALDRQIKALSQAGEPIVTWGGREYYVEEPRWDPRYKRHMTYEYKLLNYLVQGSAADVTKEAILRYHRHPKKTGRFLVTVYDEIDVSASNVEQEMSVLKECMEGIECDVLLLTDGKVGPNWGALKKYED